MKNKNGIIIFALVTIMISCGTEDNGIEKVLDFGQFSMTAPKTWTYIKQQGIDSYVGKIALDNHDTLFFDLGWYSNKLNVDPSNHSIIFTTVNGKKAKLISPKVVGHGLTGIYIDSLWVDGPSKSAQGIDRFQLNGQNLSSVHQDQFLKAIQTMKFKK